MENRPYQRKGVSSNTQAGKDFENKILFKKNNGTFLNRYIYSASQACWINELTYGLVSYTILLMKRLVVIDTNVVLSALQSKNGKSFGLISKIGSGLFDFAISVPLVL